MGFFTGNTSIRSNEQINKPTAHKVINKEGTYDVVNIGTITVKMNNKVLIPTTTAIGSEITSSFDIDQDRKFLFCKNKNTLYLYEPAEANPITQIQKFSNSIIDIYIELPNNIYCFGTTSGSRTVLYDLNNKKIICNLTSVSSTNYVQKNNSFIIFKGFHQDLSSYFAYNLLEYDSNTQKYYLIDLSSKVGSYTICDIFFKEDYIVEIILSSGVVYYSLQTHTITEYYLLKDFLGLTSNISYGNAYSGHNKIIFTASSKVGIVEFDRTTKTFNSISSQLTIQYDMRGYRRPPQYSAKWSTDHVCITSTSSQDTTKYIYNLKTDSLLTLTDAEVRGVIKIDDNTYFIFGNPSIVIDANNNIIKTLDKGYLAPIIQLTADEYIVSPQAINNYGIYKYSKITHELQTLSTQGLNFDIFHNIRNNKVILSSTDSTFTYGAYVLDKTNLTVEYCSLNCTNWDKIEPYKDGYLLSSSYHPTVAYYNDTNNTCETYGVYMEVE